jgi:hypothetical protein
MSGRRKKRKKEGGRSKREEGRGKREGGRRKSGEECEL